MRFLSTALLFTTLFASALGSSGDRDDVFEQCVHLCALQNCGNDSSYAMALALRLTCWTCSEDCKYECMQEITAKHVEVGKPIEKYYGKWPFWRFWGMQEPASVLFSFLNLLAHWNGRSKLKRRIPDTHPLKSYYLRWSLISINTWVWSAVFHTRDRPTTEKLDYFSAALSIMCQLYYTTVRIFHLYPTSRKAELTGSERPTKHPLHPLLATVCTVAYIGHVSYLTLLPRFDYTYNMAFNFGLGITHNILWTLYSLPRSLSLIHRFPSRPKSYRPKFVSKAGTLILVTMAASALELFDFPPWKGVIDAHALWHLATAPVVVLWYDFLLEDSLDPSWREQN